MFITFEGGEGAGKSTQVKLLSDFFIGLNKNVVITREPGGTRISELIREILLNPANTEMAYATEALLYAASRAQLVNEVISPALKSGSVVICDRFLDSSLVYQGYTRKLGREAVMRANDIAVSGLSPDITFLLDVPPELGLCRKNHDKLDRIELLGLKFHKEIYLAYKELSEIYAGRIKIIDGTKPVREVFKEIVTFVKQLL